MAGRVTEAGETRALGGTVKSHKFRAKEKLGQPAQAQSREAVATVQFGEGLLSGQLVLFRRRSRSFSCSSVAHHSHIRERDRLARPRQ